jgi:O-antigen/teichoic acid export membrane protein
MKQQLTSLLRRVAGSRVLRAASTLFAGDTVAMAVSIVTSVILARALGPDQYGLVILAMAAVGLVVQFLDVRTQEALIRFMGRALAQHRPDEALSFFVVGLLLDALVAALTLALVLAVIPPVIGAHQQGEVLRSLALIYALATPFIMIQNTINSIYYTLKRFHLLTAINIGTNLFRLALLAALAAGGVTAVIWGYVIAAVVGFTVSALPALALLRRQVPGARVRGARAAWAQLWPFVIHTSIMGSLKAVAVNVDVLLLGALRSPSEVTFFRIARSVVSLIAMPTTPVNTVIYPLLNEAWARADLRRVSDLIRRFMLFSGAICAVGAVGYLLLLDTMVLLVYGAAYAPVTGIAHILMIGIILEIIMGWVRTAALANGKPALVTFSGTATFAARFALVVPLILVYGAQGSALAFTLAVGVSVLLNVVYVLPRLGLGWLGSARLKAPQQGEARP